jgi:hemolysin activation/secretion protein
VFRLQAAYNRLLDWNAAVQATGTFSQGLTGRDGAQALATAIPLSRQGSSPTFSKLNVDLRYQQALPWDLQLGLIGRAQTSFGQALFSSEQFSLDGLDALSSFAAGTFSVDQGATLRGEISHPFPFNWGSLSTTVSPYIFASGGRGSLEQPTAVEQHIENAGSFGLGLRTGSDFIGTPYGSTLGVEIGRQLSDVIGEKEGYRANLAFAVHF